MLERRKIFWHKFMSRARNKYSLYFFSILFILSLFAEIISNDKPIVMSLDEQIYFPIMVKYTDKELGGYFDTEADYKDEFITKRIKSADNRAIFPLNPHSYHSINLSNSTPNPASPSNYNYLGTDWFCVFRHCDIIRFYDNKLIIDSFSYVDDDGLLNKVEYIDSIDYESSYNLYWGCAIWKLKKSCNL